MVLSIVHDRFQPRSAFGQEKSWLARGTQPCATVVHTTMIVLIRRQCAADDGHSLVTLCAKPLNTDILVQIDRAGDELAESIRARDVEYGSRAAGTSLDALLAESTGQHCIATADSHVPSIYISWAVCSSSSSLHTE